MDRIWHPHTLWEDKNMYLTFSGDKNKAIERVKEIFCSYNETRRLMKRVIDEWKYSCEHNLSNNSMNRVAWLGQACCNIEDGITEDIVRLSWSIVPEEMQLQADRIAKELIDMWDDNHA